MSGPMTPDFVGQVEQDSTGALWAVLYCGADVVSKEQVRSLRRGKRKVADLVLGASDAFVELQRSSPIRLNRFVDERPVRRHRTHDARPEPAYSHVPSAAAS